MGFNVGPYQGKRDPGSVTMSRSRAGGDEMEEMQELFEQYMGGEMVEGEEGEEEIDWEEMWNTVMGEEEDFDDQQQQGSQYPTMFGGIRRPSGSRINFY